MGIKGGSRVTAKDLQKVPDPSASSGWGERGRSVPKRRKLASGNRAQESFEGTSGLPEPQSAFARLQKWGKGMEEKSKGGVLKKKSTPRN